MTDYLKNWAESLLNARSLAIKSSVTVVGERNQHLGPRWEFAKVTVTAEPAAVFEVINKVPIGPELKALGFPDCVIHGVLDILMTAGPAPLSAVRLTIEDAAWDAIDSSEMAFRQAGREAGRRITAAALE